MDNTRILIVSCLLVCGMTAWPACGGQLHVGAASADITPSEPVAVSGQFGLRIARKIESPVTANVIALESRQGDRSIDIAIMVSCDVVYIPDKILSLVRQTVRRSLPKFDTSKIFLNGTHTHTGPVLLVDKYKIPAKGVISVEKYREIFVARVSKAIVDAWGARKPGRVSWGQEQAAVACNRRAVYADGSARMYGRTNTRAFRSLEGYEDQDVNTLFFWDADGEMIALVVNVSCPSQEVESRSTVNADFWHPVRQALRKRYGKKVCVLGWTGASGDQSPHLMYRKAAAERMRKLRGLTRLEEIARRIVRAVEDTHKVVKNDQHAEAPLIHKVETIHLPMRLVKPAEYAEAKTAVDRAKAQIAKDPKTASREYRRMKWYEVTVKRYERQKTDHSPTLETELHVLRVGDAVVCTNAFELFTDYGIRIKARSKAVQTFVVQLVGPGTYIPTAKAVRGGHYSAIVHSSLVGPEGGQMLVDRTVKLIDSLWAKPK
ncbi:MAG: hypothetical protein QGG42_20990 [Phycisphaerae bacterium]|jgi:hypothetical protein|nr:hypothetical protein [Phycisphaerae bacterium]